MRLIDADVLNLLLGISDRDIYAKYMIDKMPTEDAVPVVRCRECKQGEVDDPDFPDQYYCHAGCGWNNGDFYCAYGEKRRDKDGTT